MRLYRVILPVTNIDEGSSFYASVLGQPGKRVSGGRHYFGDANNGCVLAVYSPADDGDERRYGLKWQPHPLQYAVPLHQPWEILQPSLQVF